MYRKQLPGCIIHETPEYVNKVTAECFLSSTNFIVVSIFIDGIESVVIRPNGDVMCASSVSRTVFEERVRYLKDTVSYIMFDDEPIAVIHGKIRQELSSPTIEIERLDEWTTEKTAGISATFTHVYSRPTTLTVLRLSNEYVDGVSRPMFVVF